MYPPYLIHIFFRKIKDLSHVLETLSTVLIWVWKSIKWMNKNIWSFIFYTIFYLIPWNVSISLSQPQLTAKCHAIICSTLGHPDALGCLIHCKKSGFQPPGDFTSTSERHSSSSSSSVDQVNQGLVDRRDHFIMGNLKKTHTAPRDPPTPSALGVTKRESRVFLRNVPGNSQWLAMWLYPFLGMASR